MFTTNHQNPFGVELEVIGVSAEQVERALTEAGIPCVIESYNHTTRRSWKITTDASVYEETPNARRGNARTAGVEIVSPVLTGNAGLRQVEKVVAALNAMGARVNETCGFHVHHAATHLTLNGAKSLILRYGKAEHLIDVAAKRRDTMYSQSLLRRRGYDMQGVFTRVQAATSFEAVVEAYRGAHDSRCRTQGEANQRCTCSNRYCHINLGCYWRQGTVEFRQHAGTLDIEAIIAWVCFTQGLVMQANGTVSYMMKAKWHEPGEYLRKVGEFTAPEVTAYYLPRLRGTKPYEQVRVAT